MNLLAYLREPRLPRATIPLTAEQAAICARALEIADSATRSDIEVSCQPTQDIPPYWWDIENVPEYDREAVAEAVAYLESRGKLEREGKKLVRVLDEVKELA